MSKHTFTLWLSSEVIAAKCALLAVYEQRDKMAYIERPQLEQEYMEKIGNYEQTVIKEELECELLRKKQNMVQAAINRREPIDEAAIDAELEEERQKMLEEVGEGTGHFGVCTDEEREELQKLYHRIVKDFHPQTHPELTAVHKQLFKKAQEAYRHSNLAALQLIYEMLTGTEDDGPELQLSFELLVGENSGEETAVGAANTTDYTLAAELYSNFQPTADEAVIHEEWARYRHMTKEAMKEVKEMRTQFPHNAAEMLSQPDKIEAYREDLAYRLRAATEERERRTKEIRVMIESVAAHE